MKLWIFLSLMASTLHAQEFRATLTGHVVDPSDAPIPGVEIVVRNREPLFSLRLTERLLLHLNLMFNPLFRLFPDLFSLLFITCLATAKRP